VVSDRQMASILRTAYTELEPNRGIPGVAFAMGVITTVARYLTPDPLPFSEVLEQVTEKDFDRWAQKNDEPSFTHTEIVTFYRFLESILRARSVHGSNNSPKEHSQ